MSNVFLSYTLYIAFLIFIASCSSDDNLTPFSSDGCSLFPDASLISNHDWCECCLQHDIAYWQGGTISQREQADIKLKHCVLDRSDDAVLANVMYEGVRFGGSPYFYNWYRWGYGWPYERKYQALTKKEQKQVKQYLNEYFELENEVCK